MVSDSGRRPKGVVGCVCMILCLVPAKEICSPKRRRGGRGRSMNQPKTSACFGAAGDCQRDRPCTDSGGAGIVRQVLAIIERVVVPRPILIMYRYPAVFGAEVFDREGHSCGADRSAYARGHSARGEPFKGLHAATKQISSLPMPGLNHLSSLNSTNKGSTLRADLDQLPFGWRNRSRLRQWKVERCHFPRPSGLCGGLSSLTPGSYSLFATTLRLCLLLRWRIASPIL